MAKLHFTFEGMFVYTKYEAMAAKLFRTNQQDEANTHYGEVILARDFHSPGFRGTSGSHGCHILQN